MNNLPDAEAEKIKLIECPRDAMQGLARFIPTTDKINYLNLLLQVGFDTLDFGSFVSPKAIPQMADTKEVLSGLEVNNRTKLLAIVANLRGATEAASFDKISFIGYPFSASETFQKRNTNANINASLNLIDDILNLCDKKNKTAVVYLSMAFGNPFGDPWSSDIIERRTEQLVKKGVSVISLSDTVGVAQGPLIGSMFSQISRTFSGIEFGLHLHSRPDEWYEKIHAAYQAGCRRFDSALRGYGGCPMASDKLTGNIATENLIDYFRHLDLGLDMKKMNEALAFSQKIFI